MKKLYYLIWVETDQGGASYKDSTASGYYTDIYSVNKSKYVGYSSDPNYSQVKRFTSEKTAQNHIDKILDKQQYGGESFGVSYTFKVIPIELDSLQDKEKSSIPQIARNRASDIIKECLNKEKLLESYEAFCLDNSLDHEESQDLLNALNNILHRINKIL